MVVGSVGAGKVSLQLVLLHYHPILISLYCYTVYWESWSHWRAVFTLMEQCLMLARSRGYSLVLSRTMFCLDGR